MPKLSARNEGVRLRPFTGAAQLQESLEKNVFLRVETTGDEYAIEARHKLAIPPEQMRLAGLEIKIRSLEEVVSAAVPMVLDLADVDVLIVAIDGHLSPMRSMEVLVRVPLNQLTDKTKLNTAGTKSDSLVLSNSTGPYKIELALVHNKSVHTKSAVKPRSNGALLGKVEFDVIPIGPDDYPKPQRMTKEFKIDNGLSKTAWIYVEFTDALLSAELIDDAFSIYVDSELLDLLVIADPLAKSPIQGTIISSFIHALCFELKSRLQEENLSEEETEFYSSAVFRLVKKSFKNESQQEILETLLNSPSLVATKMLSDASLLKGLKAVMEVQEND